MKKVNVVLFALIILLPIGMTANGDTYTSSPAQGGFNLGVSASSSYSYKAGEFHAQVDGVLPPTNEKLKITSGGAESGWQEVGSIDGLGPEPYIVIFDDVREDEYYAWQPGKPGLYEFRLNVTLKSVTEVIGWTDTQTKSYSKDVTFKLFKDERLVCNPSMYETKVPLTGYPTSDNPLGYSSLCGAFDQGGAVDNYVAVKQDKDLEDTGDNAGNADRSLSSSYLDYQDSNENKRIILDKTLAAPTIEQNPSQGQTITETKTETYYRSGTVRIRQQSVDPRSGDRRGDAIIESFHVYRDAMYDYGKADLKVNQFSLNYIDPIGSTLVQIGDRKFTGNVMTTSDYSDTIPGGSDGKWDNTSVSFQLDMEGQFEGLSFDDPRRVILQGKYKAISPSGVTPEGYRWKNVDTGKIIANITGINSNKASAANPYVSVERDIDTESDFDIDSGKIVLQVKSDATYPVEMGLKDFTAKADEYIRYQESKTFSPDLKTGQNTVEVYTSNSNTLSYKLTWKECLDPVQAGSIGPANNSVVSDVTPTLNFTTNCPSIDNITFRNAQTDTVLEEYHDVPNGKYLEANTTLSFGDTYQWYIRFCDQGECHSTDMYQFSVGSTNQNQNTVSETVLKGKALSKTIRDEDFNPYGQDNALGKPLGEGYVNKLEEQSDQLEPAMDTDTLQGYRIGARENWSNSVGTKNSADQYAITASPKWVISNRGVPYPPWGSYYRDRDNARTSTDDRTILKTQKVFGNSLAVVAAEDVYEGSTLVAREGAGVWIDPDNIKWTKPGNKYAYTGPGTWQKQLLNFNLDLTGPDSGLGYDNDEQVRQYQEGRKVVQTDIHFKRANP